MILAVPMQKFSYICKGEKTARILSKHRQTESGACVWLYSVI